MKITSCVPLVIYLILIALNIVSYILSGAIIDSTGNVIIHLISAAVVSGLLYWLCSIKYIRTAWVVLLLPIIVLVLILLTFFTSMAALTTTAKIGDGRVSARIRTRVRGDVN
tara:strand:+ start:75 stop:410 length:336 start_codon:yes stop_codon:yes gene_type:complete